MMVVEVDTFQFHFCPNFQLDKFSEGLRLVANTLTDPKGNLKEGKLSKKKKIANTQIYNQ